jgi:hypothetical protein
MPAKKNPAGDAAAESDADAKLNTILAQLASMNTNMTAMNRRLDKVDLLSEQLNNIEESMRNLVADNTNIKATLASNQASISSIQANQVNMDQYNRSWSVRILELQLSPEEEANPFRLAETVYNKVFLPILSGALSEDLIPRIPPCEQLLERAHVLPASKAGSVKPIICRFFNRDYKAICFRLKKKYASKITAASGSGDRPRYAYPFYEDLSAAVFKKMKELQADSRVDTCWSVNGQLRYRLTGSETVTKVSKVLEPIEAILK